MSIIIINNQYVEFFINNDNNIFCTSLDVARVFGKRHNHVLRDIENILNDLREIGDLQCKSNFELSFKVRKIQGFKGRERKYPYYNLTRDGFSLLAMGFTGKKALQWKIAFINAFNQMEHIIKQKNFQNKYLIEITQMLTKKLPQDNFMLDITLENRNTRIMSNFKYEVGKVNKDDRVSD